MNKRAVKEILVGFVLGGGIGSLILLGQYRVSNFIGIINIPVALASNLFRIEFLYIPFTIFYFGFLGIIILGLIDSKMWEALLLIVMLLVAFHVFNYFALLWALRGI